MSLAGPNPTQQHLRGSSSLQPFNPCHRKGRVVMRWSPWSSESKTDNSSQDSSFLSSLQKSEPTQPSDNKSAILDWKAFTEPRTLISSLVLTSGILVAIRFQRRFLRRFPDAPSISPSWLRRRTVFGKVTSVGDGDNFRIYHTPGGRLAGWGWLPWKKVPTNKKELKDQTVSHAINLHPISHPVYFTQFLNEIPLMILYHNRFISV